MFTERYWKNEKYLMEKRQLEQEQNRMNVVSSLANPPAYTPVGHPVLAHQDLSTMATETTIQEDMYNIECTQRALLDLHRHLIHCWRNADV